MDKIKESAKAVASLVASICVAVIAVGVDGSTGKVLAIVAAVAGAVITWAVPNQSAVNPSDPDVADDDSASLVE